MGSGKLVFGFFTQEQITAWFSLSSHVVGSNHKWTDPTTSRGNTVLTVQLIHAHFFLARTALTILQSQTAVYATENIF